MSELSDIVTVTISRETTAVSQPSFGVPGIIAEFATSKTTPAFVRGRFYGSIAEMATEGWSSSDAVYKAAQAIFSQSPVVEQIFVGRKDAADADWAEALSAIEEAESNWYGFGIIPNQVATVVYSADFVALNSIAMTVNGTAITPVVYTTSHDNTMDLLAAQIESSITGSTVVLTDEAGNNRTLEISVFGAPALVTTTVTLGATQATATITVSTDVAVKETMAWTETQKKLFFYNTTSADAYDSGSTDDLGYFAKNAAYERTISTFHKTADSFFGFAWMGECFPFDPGSQTWAYKALSGVQAYAITKGQRNALLDKHYNIYTTRGGVNVTEDGNVASGEYIDVMRGIDWLESALEVAVFGNLVNKRKIPYSDEGIALIETTVSDVLQQAVRRGVLQDGSVSIRVPKYADISSQDILARVLPDVTFTALIEGAIHKVRINGTVSV